jgi:hypothetical protein
MAISKKTIFLPNTVADSAHAALVNVIAAAAIVARNVEARPMVDSYGNKYPYATVAMQPTRAEIKGSIIFNLEDLRIEKEEESLEFNDFVLTVVFNHTDSFYETHDDLYLAAYEEARAEAQHCRQMFPNGHPYAPVLKDNMQQLMPIIKSADINGHSILHTASVYDRMRTTSFVFGEGCLFLQEMLNAIAKATVVDKHIRYGVSKESRMLGLMPSDPVIDLFMLTYKGN